MPIKSDIKPNIKENINKNCRTKCEDKESGRLRKITNQTINFQKELDNIIENIENSEVVPTLLLHSCCGPCSSYVLEYLSKYFSITVFYYNPNIYPSDEYWNRVEEQKKIIEITESKYPINMITGAYDVDRFYKMAHGREAIPEGGERCHLCYEIRLREAAKIAKQEGFDYFTTTLSISPHKNSRVLNEIGMRIAEEYEVRHLPADFKKNNGYKRSVEITSQAGIYRQDYCGCEFSKKESDKRRIKREKKALREHIKKIYSEIEKEYLEKSEAVIIEKFLCSDLYKNSNNIFCYVGKFPEIDTLKIINRALSDGKKVSVPYCVAEHEMKALIINSVEELSVGQFGILEPDEASEEMKKEDADLVVVPCCTCDKSGNRLGYGRGYYDRYLEQIEIKKIEAKKDMAKNVLLIRKKAMVDVVPTDEHDIRVEVIITE
ncbi:5-formyltetrahydrofolate cyclo-ligase [Peptostreptococcus sp. D1]|uniref:5-formyltetrahydrofolate cyclo-ligase n=1 Tax=Peptostreptococcus sp. D1 TaxID=72304 RepID=UPI0008E30510|nr:5-formyltetrahydrofolate cyclo-ligase [Peptostreptococcus sp. D1]SFE23858.1 5,10-methenyltetrahydrofolate synthetase [Peptostreptococcus sp. D1]